MGADIIQARYDELASIAERFARSMEAADELERRVRQRFEPLAQGGWVGKGSEAFCAEMNSKVFPGLQRLSQVLREAQAVTLAASDTLRQAEQEAARLFGGAGGGGEAQGGGRSVPGQGNGESLPRGDMLDKFLDRHGEQVHEFLSWIGAIPRLPLPPPWTALNLIPRIANGLDALLYLKEGKPLEAAIGFIPMPGSKALKNKVAGLVEKVGGKYLGKYAGKVSEAAENIYNKLVGDRISQAVDSLSKIKSFQVNGSFELGGALYNTNGQGQAVRVRGDFQVGVLRSNYGSPASSPNGDTSSLPYSSGSSPSGGMSNLRINKGGWEHMKQTWVDAQRQGHSVEAGLDIRYMPGGDYRPVALGASYRINNETYRETFRMQEASR